MSEKERERELAARRAVEWVEHGMLLGLGTGGTASWAIRLIGERVRQGLQVQAIPTSRRTEELARAEGIPLIGFAATDRLDLTIDGADEVDGSFCLIKGGGGALLREKIVAAASDRVVIVGDSQKLVSVLGRFPLPVEVIPFGWQAAARRIRGLGAEPVLRHGAGELPFRTDEGNLILDCPFGQIADPEALSRVLSDIPGVVEHGLFVGLATAVVIGRGDTVEVIERRDQRSSR